MRVGTTQRPHRAMWAMVTSYRRESVSRKHRHVSVQICCYGQTSSGTCAYMPVMAGMLFCYPKFRITIVIQTPALS